MRHPWIGLAAALVLSLPAVAACGARATTEECIRTCEHSFTVNGYEGVEKGIAKSGAGGDALDKARVDARAQVDAELVKARHGQGALAANMKRCSDACTTSPPPKTTVDCILAAKTGADIDHCVGK